MNAWFGDKQRGWLHIPDQSVSKFKDEDGPPLNIGNLIAVSDGLGSDSVLKIPFPSTLKSVIHDRELFNQVLFDNFPSKDLLLNHPTVQAYFYQEFLHWFNQKQPVSSSYLGSRLTLGSLLCHYVIQEEMFKSLSHNHFSQENIELIKNNILSAIESSTSLFLHNLNIPELNSYDEALRVLRCTLTIQILSEQKQDIEILTLWAGDSRAYVLTQDRTYALTKDHQASQENEAMNRLIQFKRQGNRWYLADLFLDHTVIKVRKPCLTFVFTDGLYSPFESTHPDLVSFELPSILLDYTTISSTVEELTGNLHKHFGNKNSRFIGDDCACSVQFFPLKESDISKIWNDKGPLRQWIQKHYQALVGYIQQDQREEEFDSAIKRITIKHFSSFKNLFMNLPLPDNDYTKAYEFFNPILNAFEEPKKVQENYTQSVKKILQNQLDEFLDYAIENNIIDQLTVGLVSKIPFQKNETLRLSQALMILKEKEHNLNKNIDSLVSRIETILINSIKDWKTIKYDKGKNLYGDYYMRFIQQTKEIITSYEHFSTLNQILLVCIGYQPKSDVLTILTNKDHAPDFNRFTIKLQSEIQYFNELKYIENKFLKTETCVPFIHELRSIQKQISEKETTLTELKTSIFHAMQKDQHKISNHMYQLIIDPKNKLMDRWRSPFTSLNAPTLIQPNLESIIQDIIKNHYKVLVYDSFSNKNNLLQALPDREREEILKTYQTFIGSKTENTNLARSYFNVVYQYLRIE